MLLQTKKNAYCGFVYWQQSEPKMICIGKKVNFQLNPVRCASISAICLPLGSFRITGHTHPSAVLKAYQASVYILSVHSGMLLHKTRMLYKDLRALISAQNGFQGLQICATPAVMEKLPLASSVEEQAWMRRKVWELSYLLKKGEHLAYKSMHYIFITTLSNFL